MIDFNTLEDKSNEKKLLKCELQKLMYPKILSDEDEFGCWIIGTFTQHETRRTFTAKGTLLSAPQIGLCYNLQNGKWVDNTFNGRKQKQFDFKDGCLDTPTDEVGIFKYLSKQIGEKTAFKLCQQYGNETIKVLKESPERVKEIKGLSEDKINNLVEFLNENEEREGIIIALEKIIGGVKGIPKTLVQDIVKQYGNNSILHIKESPYKTLTYFNRVGFILADRIAMEALGVKPDSKKRKIACIFYAIKSIQKDGHVWAYVPDVVAFCNATIHHDVSNEIEKLIESGMIVKDEKFITKKSDYDNEKIIAKTIVSMLPEVVSMLPEVMCTHCYGDGVMKSICPFCNYTGASSGNVNYNDI